jgi:predicted aconitase with swiveling domain
MDPVTGRITDLRHPQVGQSVTGRILVMPFGRGSSGGSSVIAEGIRAGTAPSAILLLEPDEIVTLGAIVADELYGESMPVVVLAEDQHSSLRTGQQVTVAADGTVVGT